ncbi:uncharacterized protein LOC143447449 [Clavelina lepadiformis]|uniref:uncharacterized protein LOC143447449 n=1 Tax=Clavelina lepadiformis TaxID=159417 RepID=UPI0040423B04
MDRNLLLALLLLVTEVKGQSLPKLSPLKLSPQQSTNSTLKVSCTAALPDYYTAFNLVWDFNGVNLGNTELEGTSVSKLRSTVSEGIYSSRTDISNSGVTENVGSTEFTSIVEITNLEREESGFLIRAYAVDGGSEISSNASINVTDCPSNLPNNVTIESSSREFMNEGKFKCPDTGELVYKNSSLLTSSATVCLESAEWKSQQNLQCWFAPIVTIESNLTVKEGDDLEVTCDYAQTFPQSNQSTFYIGDEAVKEDYGVPSIVTSLTPSDNNKTVSCQANSPLTDIEKFNDLGTSLMYYINVIYGPRDVTNTIVLSQYVVEGARENEYVVRSDQNITMSCGSDANPPAGCRWHLNDELSSTTGCTTTFHFSDATNVTCVADNGIEAVMGAVQLITLVDVERQTQLSDDVTTNNGSVKTRLGDSFTFVCSVDYEEELATKFRWLLPNTSFIMDSTFTISSLRQSDSGKYTCLTEDQFGNGNSSIFLDILYAAYQEIAPSCGWNLNQAGLCEVTFQANPSSYFVEILKVGYPAMNQGSNSITSLDSTQKYFFVREQVTSSDAGSYTLLVSSSEFPDQRFIAFDVDVESSYNELLIPLIVVSCIAGLLLIFLIIFLVFYCIKKKKKNKTKQKASSYHDNLRRLSDIPVSAGANARTNGRSHGPKQTHYSVSGSRNGHIEI